MSYNSLFRKLIPSVCSLFVLFPVFVLAADVQPFAPSYQGEELTKVREWEKTFEGKKIDSANVDQVKEFIPESFYNMMKDGKRLGEWWFTIVPYQEAVMSEGYVKATKQYFGQTTINASGEIENWTAGVPFPDTTEDALKMAHNFRTLTFGDAYNAKARGYIVDGRLKYNMENQFDMDMNFFTGRTDTPPVPRYANNPKNIWRAYVSNTLAPPEVRNMRILEVHYNDFMKPFDSWYWMPSIRRVRRRSTTERQDAQGGADVCAYDNMGWDGPVSINKYKYLGTKEYLMARHTNSSKLEEKPGECLFSGTQRERIKTHVIEAKNNDPNFLYSKMIWYLDSETWQMVYSDRYDRSGKLWKVYDQLMFVGKGYNGVPVNYFCATQMIDVPRIHSTLAKSTYEFGKEFGTDLFSMQYLQKYGY
jgi:hypothetical protein